MPDRPHDAGVQSADAPECDARAEAKLEAIGQSRAEYQRSGRHESVALGPGDQEHSLDDQPRAMFAGARLALGMPAELRSRVTVGQQGGANPRPAQIVLEDSLVRVDRCDRLAIR